MFLLYLLAGENERMLYNGNMSIVLWIFRDIIMTAALAALVLTASLYFEERIADVLPLCMIVLIFVLYPFAVLQCLSASFYAAAAFLAGLLILIIVRTRRDAAWGKDLAARIRRHLKEPGVLVFLTGLVLILLCENARIAVWWDDLNYWASDAKSLLYLDGFASKYGNVSPSFGDYQPAGQLFKWWFLSLAPGRSYQEGLLYIAYHVLILSFLMPLAGAFLTDRRLSFPIRLPVCAAAAVLALAAPTVCETFCCTGMCAEVPLGLSYGLFLFSSCDRRPHRRSWYPCLQLTLLLMFLDMMKLSGILWAFFGVLFLVSLRRNSGKTAAGRQPSASGMPAAAHLTLRERLLLILLPVLTLESWLAICLLNRRVSKLTGESIRLAGAHSLNLTSNTAAIIRSYLTAFFLRPLHRAWTFCLDLTPALLFFLILAAVLLFTKKGLLRKQETGHPFLYFAVTGLLFYVVLLICHLTIFVTEEQYLSPDGMVASIERYGAPFFLSALYFLGMFLAVPSSSGTLFSGKAALLFRRSARMQRFVSSAAFVPLLCAMAVVLCADWPAVWQASVGYRAERSADLAYRDSFQDASSREFLTQSDALWRGLTEQPGGFHGCRILYLRDDARPVWMGNTYISYAASPAAVIFGSVSLREDAQNNAQQLLDTIGTSHAQYLYTEAPQGTSPETADTDAHSAGGNLKTVLDPLTADGSYRFCRIYRIDYSGSGFTLTALPETGR
jgi:hypothetical protein